MQALRSAAVPRAFRRLAVAAGCVVAACASSPAFVTYPGSEVAGVANAHDYRGRPLCQRCHPGGDSRLAVDPVELCLHCHQREHGVHPKGHPMGAVLAERPERLLLWRGRLVCHTCHDPHDVASHRYGLRMDPTPLCLECHRRFR